MFGICTKTQIISTSINTKLFLLLVLTTKDYKYRVRTAAIDPKLTAQYSGNAAIPYLVRRMRDFVRLSGVLINYPVAVLVPHNL